MPTAGYAYALTTATDQSGLGRSVLVQCQTVSPAQVVCSLSPSADNPKSEISTSAGHQHSSPATLLYVLVWALQMGIGLADLVPR